MFNRLKLVFTPPVFVNDEENTSIARHMYVMTWIVIGTTIAYTIILPVIAPQLIKRVVWSLLLLIPQAPVLIMDINGHTSR